MQSSRLKNWRQRHNSSRTTISLSLCLPPRHTHTHTQCLGANQSWALSNMVDLKNLLFLSHSLSLPPRHSLSHTHTHTHTHLMTWLASILRIVSLSLSITYHPDTHTHTHLMAKIGINSQNWHTLSLSLSADCTGLFTRAHPTQRGIKTKRGLRQDTLLGLFNQYGRAISASQIFTPDLK